MPRKILIAYANAGAGHKKAALAVESAFKEIKRSDIETKVIDTLDYSTPFFKNSYPAFYLSMVNKIPYLWGLFYYLLDTRIFYRCIASYGRRLHNSLGFQGLVKFLNEYNPDIVINAHFLGSEVMANMKKKGMMRNTKLISVVTDYMPHSFWIDKAVDYYCVAQEDTKNNLMARGVPGEKVRVFGIPIDPVFGIKKDRKELSAKIGIDPTKNTVLIGSGGFGVGPIKELVEGLITTEAAQQILVICGNNQKLYNDIAGLTRNTGSRVRAYPYVENMDEMMSVADVMVTKSGGLTSSEAMAKDLPMIITSAIPGQEARNSDYLVKSGVAVKAYTVKKAEEAIEELFKAKEKLASLKNRIGEIKKPNAASDIANFAISLLEK